MLYERQATFTLEKLKLNYSEEEAKARWNARQEKWLAALNAKSEEEKKAINARKAVNLKNLQRKYGEEEGERRYRKILERRRLQGSTEANNFFKKLLGRLSLDGEAYWALSKTNSEFFLFDKENKKYFFYDFTLREQKIIIEYNGESFHPRKSKLTEDEWNSWKVPFTNESAQSKYEFDCYKKNFAIEQGFKVVDVWSSDDFEESFEKIVKCITTNTNKDIKK